MFPRNRAVAAALEEAPDFIAQLDDDAWPCSRWLAEMLRVQLATNADLVGGPVAAQFAHPPPTWLERSDFYFYFNKRRADMARCLPIGDGNVLFRARLLGALMPEPFDPRFNISGGQDLLLFHQLAKRGAVSTWAAHALVFEVISEERMNMSELRQRALRHGNVTVRLQRVVKPRLVDESLRMIKTLSLLGLGALGYVICWPHPVARRHAELMIWRGTGKLMAHAGYHTLDPRTIDGS